MGTSIAGIAGRRFSTTTLENEVALDIAMMNTLSPYFTYSVTVMCGIPKIQLEGTLEDWVSIQSAVKELARYDLDWWVKKLIPVIDEFVNARKGNVSQKFWSEIFEIKCRSRGCTTISSVNGWVLNFFPYVTQGKGYQKNPVFALKKIDGKFAGVNFSNFPDGISKADLLFIQKDSNKKLFYLFAGLAGIRQDDKSGFLKPEISWAVIQTDKKPPQDLIDNYKKRKIKSIKSTPCLLLNALLPSSSSWQS